MTEAKDVEDDGSKSDKEWKLDLNTILLEEIGQFGRYQKRTLALCLVVALFAGYSSNEYVFSAARIPTRCEISECPSAEFAPPWLELAMPSAGGSFDNCARFNGSSTPSATNGSCPADVFDQGTVVSCEEDRLYRYTLNAFNRAWLGLARSFTTSYTAFIILEFLEALFGAAGFSCAHTIAMELVGPRYRVPVGSLISSCFAVGTLMQAAVAWALPYWRHFYLALYIPQLPTIVFFWIMPESVRWYMSKGRYSESEAVLKQAAKVNGRILSDKSLQGLKQNSEEERKKKEIDKEQKVNEPGLFTQIFQHKAMILRCTVTPLWWLTSTLVYYGLSMNAVNIVGNKYLNYMAVTIADILGFWTSALLNWVGRRPLLCVGFWICAACQFGYIFMYEGYFGLSLTLYLLGKFCISIVASFNYVYTNELYPTRYRTTLLAFSSMIGRLGAIAAPLTPALGTLVWEPLPFVLFGSLAALAGLLVLLTPETRGAALPDTMQQAADLGRHKHQT